MLVDWENVDVWLTATPTKRTITAGDWETVNIQEKIDLFDDWRKFQFRLTHSWPWYIEVVNTNFRIKPLKIQEYYY